MMLDKVLSAALVCAFMLGCSTAGRSYTGTNMQETLAIDILPNDSKMFVYRLQLPDDKIPSGVRIERAGMQSGDEPRGIAVGGATQHRLAENAAYVVERMGYCREGFLTLDSSVSQYNLWLKGECKDAATEDDKKKFGLKQVLPVTLQN